MRRVDTADEMRSCQWETRFPKSWYDWVRYELFAVAVLQNRTNWVEGLLDQGVDTTGLDHCGDNRICDACHSCQHPQILDILRAKGLKLNDLGSQRENRSAAFEKMHARGRMTQTTFDWLDNFLSEEEAELREKDLQLLQDLERLHGVPEPRKFASERVVTGMA
jgi:hypothetical protein